MAQNITLLGASYTAVPAVLLPKTGGGTARFDDTTDADAVAADITQGKTAYVNGVKVAGSISKKTSSDLTASGATVTVPAGYYENGASKSVAIGTVTAPSIISGTSAVISSAANNKITLQEIVSVAPTIVTAGYVDMGTFGNSGVSLTASVETKAAATITPGTTDQTIYNNTYLTGNQVIKGDANLVAANIKKDVPIFGVTGSYEGSGGSSTYTLTNIVPAQTIATTTSNLYGYVGLIPTYTEYVQSGEWYLVTYDNNEYVVTGYYGANSEILIGDYQLITSNVEWLETPFMVEHNLTNGYFFLGSRVSGNHTLKVDKIEFIDDGVTLIGKTIKANGTYTASSDNADGYDTVTVNVPSSSPNLQARTNVNPTTSSQTITADSGYDGLSSVQINAMPSMTLPTAASASSSGTSKATITPGSSAQYLNIPTGYNATAAYYTIAASSGGSGLTLLKTTSLGTLSTSSTSASDTGKSMTVTGYNDYDVLVVDVSVDSPVNNRHTSTVSMVYLTGTSSVDTKNTYAVGSNKWNSRLSSTGTASTRQSSTAYGIYANAATVSNSTMTITFYQRYNSNNTGTINGTYTARVYGLKLYDLIGG